MLPSMVLNNVGYWKLIQTIFTCMIRKLIKIKDAFAVSSTTTIQITFIYFLLSDDAEYIFEMFQHIQTGNRTFNK